MLNLSDMGARQVLLAVTYLGDTGFVLPLTALLAGGMGFYESRHAAWLLLRAMLVCLGVMAAFKMLLIACGYGAGIGIVSPSGHASMVTFFYGALAVITWTWRKSVLRHMILLCAAVVISVVAFSRVALEFHSIAEVLFGVFVGAICLWGFAKPYLRIEHPQAMRPGIAVALVPTLLLPALLLIYHFNLPVEALLRSFTPYIRTLACPA